MITTTQKKRIVKEIKDRLKHFDSQSQMAKTLGIAPAQMTRLLKGQMKQVLSDENFLRVANELGVDLKGFNWQTARTPTFKSIYAQLNVCQEQSISAMLIDDAGVGKTHTAKIYAKEHSNAVYIDCSQVKSKQLLIREIARKLGIRNKGRYADVYKDLVFYLNTSDTPLIILDEAGDLAYPAFLELKALWNASEALTGWYMMGADGLRAKVERNINNRKVGYVEIFRRFGERFQNITPQGKEERNEFKRRQLALVAKANGLTEIQRLYAKTNGSLTRLKIEFLKLKRKQA
ncbi:MAG: AAA family ATPase [Bacteroidota bacterium]|nr:AAA family ATPase [Bacteroidota bacterium]